LGQRLKRDRLEAARGNRDDLKQSERRAADLRSAEDQNERKIQERRVETIGVRCEPVAARVEDDEIAQVGEI
jgi:hypothetical protein